MITVDFLLLCTGVVKSVGKSKMVMKSGAVVDVDPDSTLEQDAHILKEGGNL